MSRYQHGATGWSCFALTARAVREVGTFDENIYPVYFEDQDYEWRLHLAGYHSEHIRDVLVVHGAEDALEYQSGSLTALANGTGDAHMRSAFTAQLLRGDNRGYMLQKWGAIKPSQPEEADARYRTPFAAQLPLSWWRLDAGRRECIRRQPDDASEADGALPHARRGACPFDERLLRDAEAQAAATADVPEATKSLPSLGLGAAGAGRAATAGPRAGGGAFARRLRERQE